MYNGSVIKELLAKNSKKGKDLLDYLGSTSRTTIVQLVNGNPTVRKLEQVADFFGVSMDVFFIRGFIANGNDKDKLGAQERKALLDLISAKDQIIEDKDRTIRLLENYINEIKKEKS